VLRGFDFAPECAPCGRSGLAAIKDTMNRLPNAGDITAAEFVSLLLVAPGFMSPTIPKAHQARLIELGLIRSVLGGLMATPAGRMVARAKIGR
jgi:hypothetical protein